MNKTVQLTEDDYWKPSAAERLLTRAIRSGRVPRHVSFIMDGNRRHARRHGLRNYESYAMGYDRALDTVEFARRVGVRYVSYYMFSVENFKRTSDQVNSLMSVFTYMLKRFITDL